MLYLLTKAQRAVLVVGEQVHRERRVRIAGVEVTVAHELVHATLKTTVTNGGEQQVLISTCHAHSAAAYELVHATPKTTVANGDE